MVELVPTGHRSKYPKGASEGPLPDYSTYQDEDAPPVVTGAFAGRLSAGTVVVPATAGSCEPHPNQALTAPGRLPQPVLQAALLRNGFRQLRAGGVLVYSTCSFARSQVHRECSVSTLTPCACA